MRETAWRWRRCCVWVTQGYVDPGPAPPSLHWTLEEEKGEHPALISPFPPGGSLPPSSALRWHPDPGAPHSRPGPAAASASLMKATPTATCWLNLLCASHSSERFKTFIYLLIFIYGSRRVACGILVPCPGIKPEPPELEAQS